ncbi:MAG TPA: TolC family protein [Longimicrobiales bacterium]|nr:TolC family protein [Longimicrobiales bacterium]
MRATCFALAALFALAPHGVLAQAPPATDSLPALTLPEAVDLARRSNPTFRQAVGALDLNGVERRAALTSQVFPNVDINLFQTGYGGNLTRRAFDNFGRPIEDPQAEWVYNSSTSQGISVSWDIQGLSFLNALKRQDRTNADRVLALATRGWVLESEVRRRFLDALEQRELLDVEQAVREARVVDLAAAQRLFDIAQRTRVDVLTAELQVAQQDQNIQQQARTYEQALLALRSYIGDVDLGPFEPAPLEFEVFDPSAFEAQALVQLALEANPGLREARAGVSGAELGVQEAKEAWFPTLGLRFDYGRLAQTIDGDAFLDFSPEPNDWQSSFRIFVGVPLFNDFFQDRAELARAQVELDNQEETLREQRLEVDRQVRTELINLNNQYQTLQLASRSQEIADEAVRLAREEYRIGTRTTEQLQETVTQAADARRQVIQARYGFADALLALEEVMGRRLPPELRGGT